MHEFYKFFDAIATSFRSGLTAALTCKIYGMELTLIFQGYEAEGHFHAEYVHFSNKEMTETQYNLIEEYIWDNIESFEDKINDRKREI